MQCTSHRKLAFLFSTLILFYALQANASSARVALKDSLMLKIMDPNLSDYWTHVEITAQLFEGLIQISARGQIQAAAAKSWRVEHAGDSITFTLRDDLKWSNGTPLTAEDFVRGFNRSAYHPTSEYRVLLQSLFGLQEHASDNKGLGAVALSKRQVRYRARSGKAIPIELFTSACAFPVPEARDITLNTPWFSWPERISNGPYKVESSTQETLDLVINPYFKGASRIYVKQATYIGHTKSDKDGTINSHLHDFLSGKVDVLPKFDTKQLAWIRKNVSTYYIEPQFPSFHSHLLLSAHSALVDWPIKKSLYQAIDLDKLGTLLHSKPSHISPDYHSHESLEAFSDYSMQAPLEIRFGVFTEIESFIQRAKALSVYWRHLPVKITLINFTDYLEMISALKSGDIDMVSSTASPDFPGRLSKFLAVYSTFPDKILQSDAFKQSVRLFSDAYVKTAKGDPGQKEAEQAAMHHFTKELPYIPLEELRAGPLIGKRFAPMEVHGQTFPRVRLSQLQPNANVE